MCGWVRVGVNTCPSVHVPVFVVMVCGMEVLSVNCVTVTVVVSVAMVVDMAVVVELLVVVDMSVVVIPKETTGTHVKSFAIQPIQENDFIIQYISINLLNLARQNLLNFLNWLDRKRPTRKPLSTCMFPSNAAQASNNPTTLCKSPQRGKLNKLKGHERFTHFSSVSK